MLSILITHYQRPESLWLCLNAIDDLKLSIPYEVIVSDDGSDNKVLSEISTYKIDKLVTTNKNSGLASNLNRGLQSCSGEYILYCQEDFLLKKELKNILHEIFAVLDAEKLDMVRLTANYRFSKLLALSQNISRIPRFSFQNFNVNTFQYSDNPFVVKQNFYTKYGYYLEKTSGPYGETEYALRLIKLKAKIGITNVKYTNSTDVASIMNVTIKKNKKQKKKINKSLHRFLRAVRQHIELLLYHPKKRKLITYKNQYVAK